MRTAASDANLITLTVAALAPPNGTACARARVWINMARLLISSAIHHASCSVTALSPSLPILPMPLSLAEEDRRRNLVSVLQRIMLPKLMLNGRAYWRYRHTRYCAYAFSLPSCDRQQHSRGI